MATSWADLHPDLLDLVVAELVYPGDRARARAVCRSWHAAVRRHGPQAAKLPWIVFPDGEFITPTDGSRWERPDSVPDNARCCGSANEWLLLGIYEPTLIYVREDEVETYCFHNYVLHNIFSLEYVPLTELDAVLHRAYHILKFRMRSTTHC
uniref:F-box domain-containing protein n=1 Tax=Aegilops tauschii TaxID=37682 RepID=R7W8B2_AEGTA